MKRHHQTEHHCFTTPSPSPPEHRIPINQLPSPNSSKLNSNPTANVFPLVNQDIFGKLLQEMTSQIQPATNNFSQSHQVLNETILQLAKLNSSQILSSPNSSVIDSDNSANTNAKAVQLLNLLTKVNDQQCIPSKNIVEQFLNTNNNNNNNHHQTSLSPQKEFISQHKHLLSEQSLVINGGGLLTTAPHESLTRSEQQNLIENTSSSTSKYTRPFKALYNNKDVGLLSQKHSPSSTTTTTSSPFPMETLATADSLLGSDQAYLMFRSQMLSMSKQRQSSMEERKSTTNRKSQHNTSANSSKSLDFTSDENSNGSSFNGTAIVDNQAITETTAQNSHHSIVTGLSPSATGSGRKRARPLPDNLKDEAYWERRRKNNEAAKRSRDLRRAKEDEIAIRASFLEHENRQLKLKLIEAELKLEKKDTLIATLQNQLSSLK
ncbi:hepatic leukemia factor-like protein [Euroglyphus maynei]|uniref:Hepatic leukemia factor-like protein n=1 Tax=Euroglyphus maynei TaxID=6958 RepID=A0A1Y3B1N6_EURMA|nr:hepatic leukemia factor-like protein [Euroglyphus maynei]